MLSSRKNTNYQSTNLTAKYTERAMESAFKEQHDSAHSFAYVAYVVSNSIP
jgi:hypothetical protein